MGARRGSVYSGAAAVCRRWARPTPLLARSTRRRDGSPTVRSRRTRERRTLDSAAPPPGPRSRDQIATAVANISDASALNRRDGHIRILGALPRRVGYVSSRLIRRKRSTTTGVSSESPRRIVEPRAQLVRVAVPERLVRAAPLGDGVEALSLVVCDGDVYIGQPQHSNVFHLDDRDGRLGRIDHEEPLAGPWDRLAVELPLDQQTGGRRLLPGENGSTRRSRCSPGKPNSAIGSGPRSSSFIHAPCQTPGTHPPELAELDKKQRGRLRRKCPCSTNSRRRAR